MNENGLFWLPKTADWPALLKAATQTPVRWNEVVAAAGHNIDQARCGALYTAVSRALDGNKPEGAPTRTVRLAVLGSSTLTHLASAIHLAAWRRGIWIELYFGDYGLYQQDILSPNSPLLAFRPDFLLLAPDARHIASLGSDAAQILKTMSHLWSCAQNNFGCRVIQQTALPVLRPLLGNNEHRIPASPASILTDFNQHLMAIADKSDVDVLAVNNLAVQIGLDGLYDPLAWNMAKQEVSKNTPLYGDHLLRVIGARLGLSKKCLVLDLDNTVWGGVIGDDGIDGILLGQGDADGEAFVEFQRYVKALADRGIILAVCSKNTHEVALAAFDGHDEMILRSHCIGAFVANWSDKPSNILSIAKTLSIGLDSMVFVDDNPFERNAVRSTLPQVAVPEFGDNPHLYADIISAAGYFEGAVLTEEDFGRTEMYRQNADREAMRQSVTSIEDYLAGLGMVMDVSPVSPDEVRRVAQLINKSNQFNLTTRRYSLEDIQSAMHDVTKKILRFKLSDKFGDNGLICVVILTNCDTSSIVIDTWLMSCRVLGRGVEASVLEQLANIAAGRVLVGEYIPSAKNSIVAEHYNRLGFEKLQKDGESQLFSLDTSCYVPQESFIKVESHG